MTNELLEMAIRLSARGMSVIPLKGDKRPYIASWKEYQEKRASQAEIKEWWAKWPSANIGIITGKISNITVVDFDIERKNGAIVKQADRSFFPATTIVQTGSGGFHYYYQYNPAIQTGARILDMVDIRNDGGYVVAPPSKTDTIGDKLGGEYKVINGTKPVEFPLHLFGVKPRREFLPVEGVGQGSRNETATKMAGVLLRRFSSNEWELAWSLLKGWNAKNNPPLSEYELKNVFNSISKREATKRETDMPVLEEDDSEVLPLAEVAKFYEKKVDAIALGFDEIDKAMRGGMIEGDMIVVSGLSGEGKTHLCQSITYDLAQRKIPSVWFSYEVSMDELWRRFQDMGADDKMISYSPLKLVLKNPTWIQNKLLEAKQKYGAKIAFIDHLGYLEKDVAKSEDPNLASNGAYRLASLCRDFKRIAIEHNMIIILLAHVRKPAHGKKEVDIHDLAYSAGIAQEADHVFIIKRNKEGKEYLNSSTLKLVKNRRTGKLINLVIKMSDGRFVDERDEALSEYERQEKEANDSWGKI